jgi:hypothetical protein
VWGNAHARGKGGSETGPKLSYTRVATRACAEPFWSALGEVIPPWGVTPDVWALLVPPDTHAQFGSHPRSLLRLDRSVPPVPAPAYGPLPCRATRGASLTLFIALYHGRWCPSRVFRRRHHQDSAQHHARPRQPPHHRTPTWHVKSTRSPLFSLLEAGGRSVRFNQWVIALKK